MPRSGQRRSRPSADVWLTLAGLGVVAWNRHMVGGLWLETWELALAGAVLALVLVPLGGGGRGGRKGKPAAGRRKKS